MNQYYSTTMLFRLRQQELEQRRKVSQWRYGYQPEARRSLLHLILTLLGVTA